MRSVSKWALAALTAVVVSGLGASLAAQQVSGLEKGNLQLQSAGPLAFGPAGVLLVGDPKAATIYAIETGESGGNAAEASYQIENLKQRLAEVLDGNAASISVEDMAVNPQSGTVYLSVSSDGSPSLVRIDAAGKISQMALDGVRYTKATLPDAPKDEVVRRGRRSSNPREDSITDLAFMDGQVIVSGLSNQDAPSSLRALAFPFVDADPGTSVEIFHGAHGRFEDYAAIRTFVPFTIDGEASLLAAYTCTPLVRFPVSSLVPGDKVRGTTLAELGNRNRPLDMIVYDEGDQTYLLLANSSRGVMKISTNDIGRNEGIQQPVRGGATAGQTYQTIESLQGTIQLDRLNDQQAVLIQQDDSGELMLKSIDLP